MSAIGEWLEGLGLGQYVDAFQANEIDIELLAEIDDQTLKDIGVSIAGHRIRIRSAIGKPKAGQPASARAENGAPIPPPTHNGDAERRHLTVMFCDLVGSTALSQQLDPEELSRLIRQYQDACVGAISRFEGYIAQYLGDGVLAYFGYPLALEGGAERAIRAGLAVIERVHELSAQREQPLQVRIGIDTGLVVIGQGETLSEQERTAVGGAPNIAARLQALAAPGTIVVSARTRELAPGGFEYRGLGAHELKGISAAVHAWQVVAEQAVETRFDAATGGLAAPMVGREMELELALRAWQQASAGKLQVLLLCGEPGIGKSRIVRALRERLTGEGAQAWQYQCSPYFVNSALYPITAHMERALKFEREDTAQRRLEKLEATITAQFERPPPDVNLLGRLFNLPVEAKYGALAMSPQKQKDETLRALADLVQAASRVRPMLMLFEDMHWADPSTLEAIDQLLKRTALRVLVVMTYRPEFKPAWIGEPHVSALTLGRLDREQIEAVVTRVTQGKPLPKEILAQIAAKTDGVPLFVEELTKAILESQLVDDKGDHYELAGPLPTLAIPNSLRDSLMARLDRLAPVKESAQIGACIGREFSDELLSLISPLPRSELTKALDQLSASELVFRRGTGKDTVYVFKHALVQDAAYDSLLKSRRAEVHARIARALEQHFPESAKDEPELLATHLTAAGLADEAILFWLKAGERSLERAAMHEAVSHFQKGLTLLSDLRDGNSRQDLDVELRVALAMAWTFLKGWAADELFEALIHAWRILEKSGTRKHAARVLWGIWAYRLSRGEAEASLEWVHRMIDEAKRVGDETLWFVGCWSGAIAEYSHGDFASSIRYADRIIERYQPGRHGPIPEMMNYDALTVALLYRAYCEARMGFADTAVRSVDQARAHDRRLRAVVNTAYVHWHAAANHLVRRDGEAAMKDLDTLEALSRGHGLAFFEFVLIPCFRAQALCALDDYEASVRGHEVVRPVWNATGMQVFVPELRLDYAFALGMLGRVDKALAEVESALEQIARPGWHERCAFSEVLRVKGWLLEKRGEVELAEAAYRESLEVAQAQRARTHELRTATGYGRMLQSQGRVREAAALLQPVYAWFTEGFDTKDLKEAKALLDDLK